MDDQQKVVAYRTGIYSMLESILDNYKELSSKTKRSEFEDGRLLAYEEVIDIIKTRNEIIWDVITD